MGGSWWGWGEEKGKMLRGEGLRGGAVVIRKLDKEALNLYSGRCARVGASDAGRNCLDISKLWANLA